MSTIFTVTMPDIGEGVVEGEVIEWLKKIGDEVKQDEPVVIVMTDKATVELPSPCPGKLTKHYFDPGQTASRDKPLYDIEIAGEVKKSPTPPPQTQLPEGKHQEPRPEKANERVASQLIARPPNGKVLATPPVRDLARKMGIDLQKVKGTGKEGRVTEEDLKSHVSAAEQAGPITPLSEDEIVPLIGVRHLMVKKMGESNRLIPHFSYFEQADATRLIALRHKIKEAAAKENIYLTYMPLLMRALSLTIKQYPYLNSSLAPDGNKLILHKQHNIGIAIATDQGLIVPVLKNIQSMSLEALIKAYDSLKRKASERKLLPNDMKEGTITISNFGVLSGGGLWATPVISPPEVAILAIAKIQKQPVVKGQEVVVRDMLNLSWSFDHRVIDGDMAASISHFFCHLIQNPAALL